MEEQEAEAYAQYEQDMADGEARGMEEAAGAEQAALDEERDRVEAAQQQGERDYEAYLDRHISTKPLTYEQLQAQMEEKKRAKLILEGRLIQYKADRGWLMEHLHGTSGIAGPYLYNEDWQAFLHMELV